MTPYYAGARAYGGIPRVAGALATALERRGHRVTVCTTDARDRATRLRRPARSGCPPMPWTLPAVNGAPEVQVFVNLSNRLAYDLQGFLPVGLRRFLRSRVGEFDVVHVHAHRHVPEVLAAAACARAGVPYVLAPNGTAPAIERRFLAKQLFDLAWGRHVLQGASCLLAVSEAERGDLLRLGAEPSRVRLVPNPLETSEFLTLPGRGAFRRRRELPPGPVVLYLGRLSPRKRVDLIVEACAGLRGVSPTLLIAGNDMGVERDLRRHVRRVGLGERTRFLGLLEGGERLEALVDADVVVYPGEHEVFGLVAAESLACGTPVVVADDSGCAEIVRAVGGGLVVPVGRAAAITTAIESMLASPAKWRERALAARPLVLARFSAEAIGNTLDEVYRAAAGAA